MSTGKYICLEEARQKVKLERCQRQVVKASAYVPGVERESEL